ncbi:MAG TPA: PA0069 family radical SAM protein [Tepidisphaeraceae bacterium]|jgi:DNA repair photolyase
MSLSLPIHGRGAAENPTNRFEKIDVVVDPDGECTPADGAVQTVYLKDSTRQIIAHNDSPDVGFEWSINPYRGCEHGCIYCLDGDTRILMADTATKALRDVRPGDEIYGTRRSGWYRRYVKTTVLAHWRTRSSAWRVTLEDGTTLIAGPNHRFLTDRGWKYVAPDERRQRPHLTLNNKLLGVGSIASPSERDVEYRRGYLCGLIKGDGLIGRYSYGTRAGRTVDNQHHFRLALADDEALNRAEEYLAEQSIATRSFTFAQQTVDRRAMRGIRTHAKAMVDQIADLVGWPDLPAASWKRGFIAGIFDAEGSYSRGILRISNTDREIISRLQVALTENQFDHVVEHVERNAAKSMQVLRVRGGLREHVRFFQTFEPAIRRKCSIEGTALKSTARLTVVSIEKVSNAGEMFDISTGTEDFIANGVVSHNCYSRPTHEWLGFSAGLDFETRIMVKADAPELLAEELASKKWKPATISVSGVTDCYQPVEKKLEITRRCIGVMTEFGNPFGMITKSALVTRDIDILSEAAKRQLCVVMLSVTTLDEEIHRVMEPRASTPRRRLEAIAKLAAAGVPVGVMVAPVVPGLTDHEVPAILKAVRDAGAISAGYVPLRLPYGVKDLFTAWLERHFPDRKKKVLNRIMELRGGKLNDGEYGSRMHGEGIWAEQMKKVFELAKRKVGMSEMPELATDQFRVPNSARRQMELW